MTESLNPSLHQEGCPICGGPCSGGRCQADPLSRSTLKTLAQEFLSADDLASRYGSAHVPDDLAKRWLSACAVFYQAAEREGVVVVVHPYVETVRATARLVMAE